jgi:hypothetical protein
MMAFIKRFFKIIGIFFLLILLGLGVLLWLLTKEKYQNIIAEKATEYLSEKLHTKVEIEHVKISVMNEVCLQGVFVADQQHDTLAYVGSLHLKTSELIRNFWNKETSVIHTVGLDDVYINLKRAKDTTQWNYDFIAEAFGSSNHIDNTANDTASIAIVEEVSTTNDSPLIDVKTLNCNRIRFNMLDTWRGEDMRYALQHLDVKIDTFLLNKKRIVVDDVLIQRVDAFVREYKGGKPKDLSPDDTASWGTPFNTEKHHISFRNLNIEQSNFKYEDGEDKPKAKEFDERHLAITNFNIVLKNAEIIDDTLYTKIENLTAKERCGIEIKLLQANAKISQVQSYLTNMTLKTNNSLLKNHYEMNYKTFHDFNDYIAKVNMKAHLKQSSISSIDVGYFANVLNQYPISINLAGDVEGTVDKLSARNMQLSTLTTSFKGDALVTGLPDIDKTIFDIDAKDLKTSGSDLNKLIPQTKVDVIAWNKWQKINFKGKYKGKTDVFNIKGNLITNLGNSIVDLNMNFKAKIPSYSGELETENFDLGTLLKQKTIGHISIKGKIDGKGFDMNQLDAKVNAIVKHIEVNGNRYNNLTINGLVSNKKFDGIFVSQDPNLALNFDGKLDLSGKQPAYHFNSRFIKFDLQKIGLSKKPMTGSGYASLNFTGDQIDNFVGQAVLKNVSIETEGQNFYADFISLSSVYEMGQKKLNLKSSIADAEIVGNFSITNLPRTFQQYLYHYLPQYINKPMSESIAQNFNYNVSIKNIAQLLNTFTPNLHGLENTNLSGTLDTRKQIFSLDAMIPHAGFQDFQVDSLQIVGAGDFSSFDLNAVTKQFYYKEEVVIPSMQLNSSMANDTASLNINTQSINTLLGEASLNCKATAMNGNLYVSVLPSNVNVNNLTWHLNCANQLVFGKTLLVQDFVLETGPQKIIINTRQADKTDLLANIENIDLENISQMANKNGAQFLGHLNGNIEVLDVLHEPLVFADVSSIDNVRIDNDTIGFVHAKISYDIKNNVLKLEKSTSVSHFDSYANVEGVINAKDSSIDLRTNLSRLNISFVNQFLADYIQNLKGLATGEVLVKGSIKNPNVSGAINLTGASVKVLYLGTSYFIDDAKFRFNNRKIEMDNIIVRDERNGNYTGLVKGYISHNNFKDFYLNFDLLSDNLLCLNTVDTPDQLFYGYIPAQITAKVKGELNDVDMQIDAKPIKGAEFHLPINSSGDASTYDFIKFAKIGRNQIEEKEKKHKASYLNLRMNIEATPDIDAYIILDRNTGEQIIARGNGAIVLNIDLGNSIEMNGAYEITDGKYFFNFRSLFPRVFTINEDSRITWNGDALAANMNIKTRYKLENNLPLFNLVASQLESLDNKSPDYIEALKSYPTYLDINLTGALSKPDIKFDILQPDNKATGSMGFSRLEQIRNDEKELVSQAGVLLLLGSFKEPSSGISTGTYRSGAISSVSDMITSALSNEINNQINKILGTNIISVNVDHNSLAASTLDNVNNREKFSVNVTAKLLKERVIVDVGNSLDVSKNVESGTTKSNYFLGNFSASYIITPDGRLRLNAYRTQNPDLEGLKNITKNGLGISYRKVFNSFNDLIYGVKKKEKLIIDTLKTNS